MASLNKTTLIGNVGGTPEFHESKSGGFCTLSIATSENWKDKQTGEPREKTEWHRLVVHDKLGEITRDHVKKGQQIYVEGALQTRKWTDKEGIERSTTEINVRELLMLGKKPEGTPDSIVGGD